MRDSAFPHDGHPRGWYQVAWTAELEPGAVRPLRYFGQDLVLFRTESGALSVLDAYCEHLGAHLGYGGTVRGECIECPFHAWQWDADGRNTLIPNSTRDSQRRRIRVWPTAETGGIVCVWYDPTGAEPAWAPPVIPRADDASLMAPWPNGAKHWTNVRALPQYGVENLVDQFHFQPVHRSARPAQLISFETDGHRFVSSLRLLFGDGKDATSLTPEGPVSAVISVVADGLGFVIFEFKDFSRTVYVNTTTPIDDETSDMRMTVYLPAAQALDGDQLTPYAAATLKEIYKQTERDQDIWRHWRYTDHPPFTPEESKAYHAIRRWARNFYSSSRMPAAANE